MTLSEKWRFGLNSKNMMMRGTIESELEVYLENDPDFAQRMPDGRSIVHVVTGIENKIWIHKVAAAGANLNVQCSRGWSSLHYAMEDEFIAATEDGEMPTDLPSVKTLIALGADPSIKDNEGLTAFDLFSHFEQMKKLSTETLAWATEQNGTR